MAWQESPFVNVQVMLTLIGKSYSVVVVGNPIFSLVLGLTRLSLVGEVLERYLVNFRYPGKYLTRIILRESASMAA